MRLRIGTLAAVAFMSALPSQAAPAGSAISVKPAFEENRGQFHREVRYAVRFPHSAILLADREIIATTAGETARIRFRGARRPASIEPIDRAPGRVQYLLGNDETRWVRGLPRYERVLYRELYRGIDALFYLKDGVFEYDLIVKPGADASQVELDFGPDQPLEIDAHGNLRAEREAALLVHGTPRVFEMDGDLRHVVPARYVVRRQRYATVELHRDTTRTTVIDPTIEFSTYVGGGGLDGAFGVATDAASNIYVLGHTDSTDLPLRNPAQNSKGGNLDVFVAKFTPLGSLEYMTYLGGSQNDSVYGGGIAVTTAGELYVSGTTTSPDFPLAAVSNSLPSSVTSNGAPSGTLAGPSDGFLTKFAANGSLLWSTYFGGSESDEVWNLALRPDGVLMATGLTSSPNLPTTNGFQKNLGGGSDAYVAAFSPAGGLLFCSYLGGSMNESARAIATDTAGATYVVGRTGDPDFLRPCIGPCGEGDLFAVKLDQSLSRFVYATRLGGSHGEVANGAAVDSQGGLLIAGYTFSTDFPAAPPREPTADQSDSSFLLARLSASGSAVTFSSVLGGPGIDWGTSVAISKTGNIYVAGLTRSEGFPLRTSPRLGSNDVLLAKFTSAGALLSTTILGGTDTESETEAARDVAIDATGAVILVGETNAPDYPLENPVKTSMTGRRDAFILKLRPDADLIPSGEMNVITVAGSTAGQGGSFFKTGAQIHNPTDRTISGRFIYHAQGTPANAADPSLTYTLAPGETTSFSDVVNEIGVSGLGSIDLVTNPGDTPVSAIRVYADAGENGTSGMSQEQIAPDAALSKDQHAFLIAPPDPARARFNIGVRSLSAGASVTFAARDRSGALLRTVEKNYPADYFIQTPAADLLGAAPGASESLEITVAEGSAIIYGSTTDNVTNDPSLQFATTSATSEALVLPVVGSAPGAFGAMFKTSVQLHNPTDARIRGRIVYHVQGSSGSDSDASLDYSLAPRETTAIDDLLPAMTLSGLGSVDVVPVEGIAPTAVVRVFNDAGSKGTSGLTEPPLPRSAALSTGSKAVLIAPPDPATSRFNVGIRTLASGATITATLRTSNGNDVKSVTATLPANYFVQTGAAALLGAQLSANDTVVFAIDAGQAFIYGSTTDNRTQDPALQMARRIR